MRHNFMRDSSFLQALGAAPLKRDGALRDRYAAYIVILRRSVWRKLLPHVTSLLVASQACAQHIDTRVLTPAAPMRITVNPNVATTLLFPDANGGAFGLGLVGAGAHENQAVAPGSIALEHPEGS